MGIIKYNSELNQYQKEKYVYSFVVSNFYIDT